MARETVISKLQLKGREILSSYASFTIEGVMSARVQSDQDCFSLEERNGIAKGTSDGVSEALYLPNFQALESIEKNIAPLLPAKVIIRQPQDIIDACTAFDLKLIEGAGPNKEKWGGNACLASSTVFFQTLVKASGFKIWELNRPVNKSKIFYMPNLAFNMVCGGEHVPGTKQDIQEMFFFAMKEKSIKNVFSRGIKFFRQFERNLVRDGLPTGTAKERGFVFPVKDNFEGLNRLHECAQQLGLAPHEYALGTDNAFSELQKDPALRQNGNYDFRFSEQGVKSREQLITFNGSIVTSANNFITMEDPGSESDPEAHCLMNEQYGNRVQLVLDDLTVTQMRFIIPFLAAHRQKQRCGNSVLIKLNQAGTFTETCLATEIVLGLADCAKVEKFLRARNDLEQVMATLKTIGITHLDDALNNIKKNGFTAFFSHRSTEGSSEFLSFLPLLYGFHSPKLWLKGGAPNGERNLQHYNPLIRAEEEMHAKNIKTVITGFTGLPDEVTIPGIQKN